MPCSGKQIQIGTGKHHIQTVLILPEPAVDGFPISKLTFDDPKNMFHLAAHRGLEILNMFFPVNRLIRHVREGFRVAIDSVVNAGKMCIISHFGPFLNTQIGGISINKLVVLADQMGCLRDVVGVCGGDGYGVYQTTESVCANVALHTKALLIALPGLVHLRITCFVRILCGAGCIDDCRIDNCAALQHVSRFHHNAVDCIKNSLFSSCSSSR